MRSPQPLSRLQKRLGQTQVVEWSRRKLPRLLPQKRCTQALIVSLKFSLLICANICTATEPSDEIIFRVPQHVVNLPAVASSSDHGELKPKSLPTKATWTALNQDNSVQRKALRSPSDISDESDLWFDAEPVVPLPIAPADELDSQWLKRNGGEQLPAKRDIYPLDENQSRKDPNSLLIDEEDYLGPQNRNSKKPNLKPRVPAIPTPAFESSIPKSLPNTQSEKTEVVEAETPQIQKQVPLDITPRVPVERQSQWVSFPSLLPNLSQRLNQLDQIAYPSEVAVGSNPYTHDNLDQVYDQSNEQFSTLVNRYTNLNSDCGSIVSQPPSNAESRQLGDRLKLQQRWNLRTNGCTGEEQPLLHAVELYDVPTYPPTRNLRHQPSLGPKIRTENDWSVVPNANSDAIAFQQKQTSANLSDFAATPVPISPTTPHDQLQPYYGKYGVPTQRPWVELWRPFYGDGQLPPAIPVFSGVYPWTPQFLVYGDVRSGIGVHRNQGQPVRSWATRLNLDMDLRLNGTERFHAFMGPLDHNNRFTRLDFSDSNNVRFDTAMDAQFDTGFFEGDLGAMVGRWTSQDAPFDLPIAAGLMPLIYQNGIWAEDIVAGVSVAVPWQYSNPLNWSNFDMTFFALFDQITSPAFDNNNGVANAFGTAWFIEAYEGYIEADYAYLLDTSDDNRSYHNAAIAYTRRYFDRISNSVRLLGNTGQNGNTIDRTADGALLLVENSLVTSQAATVVPYSNFFYGVRRPQSLARAAGAGGILRNTGILFESDNLTAYPTLDSTANNSYGGAVGINLLTPDFRNQMVFEFAALDTYGDSRLSTAAGPQYGFGTRYQHSLTNWTLIRLDAMVGLLDDAPDIYGTRAEWRWKF